MRSSRNKSIPGSSWRRALVDAYRAAPPWPGTGTVQAGPDADAAGFLVAVAPLIEQGRRQLAQQIAGLEQARGRLPFDSHSLRESLLQPLPPLLLGMLLRTMTLELHVARLQGELHGETPTERFASFVQLLRNPDRTLQILEEYPVLSRLLVQGIRQWVEFSVQCLTHLTDDIERIGQCLHSGRDPGELAGIHCGMGDRHRGGQSVVLAEFDSGFRAVYKPKSLAVDAHFQQLLDWLNERGADPPFRTLQVLDRGTHGWTEFIVPAACRSQAEVERFYRRQGAYLALLRALSGTDFHCDNVIACGEHPMLVDLEALFHRMPRSEGADAWADTLRNSVIATGLLPDAAFDTEAASPFPVDVSGLGGPSEPSSAQSAWQCEGEGTDQLRVARRPLPLLPSLNRPAHEGVLLGPHACQSFLVEGFRSMYELLVGCRDDLLAPGGPLERFAVDEVRFIPRQTRSYGILLEGRFHPDRLRDEQAQDLWWGRLTDAVPRCPWLQRLIPFETADLDGMDVPLFTTSPGSRDLFTSRGDRVAGFFEETGLQTVGRRLRQMGREDFERQVWLIGVALAAVPGRTDQSSEAGHPRPEVVEHQTFNTAADNKDDPSDTREKLLAAALSVGERLESLAWRQDDLLTWLGLETEGARWKVRPLGADLYDGLPGLALFFAYLGDLTGEQRFTMLARRTWHSLRRWIEDNGSQFTVIGGFTGWGGVIYALSHLAALWNDPQPSRDAALIVDRLGPLIEQDAYLDIVDGSAGCLLGLLSLHCHAPSAGSLAAAVQCGERLLAALRPMDAGRAWPLRAAGEPALTGFAHGSAGMRWALLELSAHHRDDRLRDAARDTLTFERHRSFTPDGDWRDPQSNGPDADAALPNESAAALRTSWCHGAAGTVLSRLQALVHFDDPRLVAEARAARVPLTSGRAAGNHSLCHGDLGNLDVLLQAATGLNDEALRRDVRSRTRRLGELAAERGWVCATPAGVESPGLMTGLAGIGYGLLRLAAPERIPSVLALAPPAVSRSTGNANR